MDKNKRYTFLLCGLMLIFALSPIANEFSSGYLITSVLSVWILVASLYAVWSSKRYLRIIATLGILSLVFQLVRIAEESSFVVGASLFVQILFFLAITWTLLRRLFTAKKVSTDTILGVISVYFLIGLTWGFIYQTIELISPAAFSHTVATSGSSALANMDSSFFYFSFISMTTVGYGDIVPLHPVARSFAMLQGIAGQMYIAILVARLVALHILGNQK